MRSAALDTPRWLRIALVASAGLITACSSDASAVRAGADATTLPPVPSTTVTTASPTPPPSDPATTVPSGTSQASPATTTATVSPSIEDCRSDQTCPSSEHRTGDACGAELIVDVDGYLEGRRDAEAGRPYQIDNAPAPTADDDDDDDATVGPQTRYRAGYVQGWCDGSST
jgi:hypothetical protein